MFFVQFFKEDGCNKMKCSCGATMCYICRFAIMSLHCRSNVRFFGEACELFDRLSNTGCPQFFFSSSSLYNNCGAGNLFRTTTRISTAKALTLRMESVPCGPTTRTFTRTRSTKLPKWPKRIWETRRLR